MRVNLFLSFLKVKTFHFDNKKGQFAIEFYV